MPRLLDTRLIGYDIADVKSRSYGNASPGQILRVSQDGQSMELATVTQADLTPQSLDSVQTRTGLSIQQYLTSTWVDITPGTMFNTIYGITYGAGTFVVVGESAGQARIAVGFMNPDTSGFGFTAVPLTDYLNGGNPLVLGSAVYGVIFAEDQFIACGAGGSIISSPDGFNWTQKRSGGTEVFFRAAYAPDIGYVFVGMTNLNTTAEPGITVFSSDLVQFNTLATSALGAGVPVYGVSWGNGTFMAVGGVVSEPAQSGAIFENHIATSPDGQTWTLRQTTPVKTNRAHYTVTYGNGRWIAGTSHSPSASESCIIVSRNNGVSWELQDTLDIGNSVQTISYGNGLFVSGAINKIGYSPDGLNWAPVTPPDTFWSSLAAGDLYISAGAWGNGIFLLANRGGRIVRSQTIVERFVTGGGGGGSTGPLPVGTIPFVPNPGDVGSYTLAVAYDENNGGIQTAYPGITKEANQLRLAGIIPVSDSSGTLNTMGTYNSEGNLVAAWTGTWKNMGTACGEGLTIAQGETNKTLIVWGLWMRIS